MELGPIQKKWIADLRAYPERQINGELGEIDDNGKMCLCCLGQAVITKCEFNQESLPFHGKELMEYSEQQDLDESVLTETYKDYGLYSRYGTIKNKPLEYNNRYYQSLVTANDSEVPWKVIADFIENNPENVFTHSV